MRKCKGCQEDIPFRVTIEGKRRNLRNRKYCISCSPFGEKKPIKNPFITPEELKLKKQKRLASNVKSVSSRRRKVIMMAIEHLGGKCSLCGYSKCIEALEFHHLDPSKKSFGIGSGATKSWEKVKAEVDKCVLLCANCHREVGYGVTFL